MCRRAGTKTGWGSRWPGFGTTTGTRMASWLIKISRIGRPSLHLRRNSAARTAAPGLADGWAFGAQWCCALKPEMSMNTVVEKRGRPDAELGSGLYIFVWRLADGSMVSIGTATLQRIGDVKYTDPSGKKSSLLN